MLSRRKITSHRVCDWKTIIAPPEQWPRAVAGFHFDTCVHLAWIATPGLYLTSEENGPLSEITVALAEALFKGGLEHFLATGTCIEYSPGLGKGIPCIEDETPIAPIFPYAVAKNQARVRLQSLAAYHGAGFSWGRVFYAYGPEEPLSKSVTMFIRTLLGGEHLVLKHPHSTKDFVHVDDIVGALAHLVSRRKSEGVVNIGTGHGTTMRDLALQVAREVGAEESLVGDGDESLPDPYSYHVADVRKMGAAGWQSSIAVPDGIRDAVIRAL